MAEFNINGNLLSNTEAGWGADATKYSNKTMLISTDVQYGVTDQNKFKLANGSDVWSDLDYMPIGAGGGTDSHTLLWQTQSINFADATVYWLIPAQTLSAAVGTNGNKRHCMPVAASEFTLNIGLATNGTTELVTWRIRNHTQGTEADFTPGHAFTASGQANAWVGTATLAFDAGDYVEIKLLTPTWVTNPTSTRIVALLNFEAD